MKESNSRTPSTTWWVNSINHSMIWTSHKLKRNKSNSEKDP
jgi:hypothetical protein